MTTLHLTEEQLRIVQKALDFYSRIGIGQFERIKDHPTFERSLANKLIDEYGKTDFTKFHKIREEVDIKMAEARNMLIQENLPPNGGWGIGMPKVDETCKVAYDIVQVIRHEFWKANPERSNLTVDSNVSLLAENSDKILCKLSI